MKKHSLLIMSILLLLVSFAAAWYSDHLVNRLFVYALLIFIVLFICFAVLLAMSIRSIIKRKDVSGRVSLLVLVSLAALMAFFPFRDARVNYELDRFEADRLEIVRMIQNDQLQPADANGNVILPAGYERLSSDGEVFVYQNDGNGQVISFWVFRGMLSGSVELIYSSGGEELIRANESGQAKIDRLRDNWYYVETDY